MIFMYFAFNPTFIFIEKQLLLNHEFLDASMKLVLSQNKDIISYQNSY